MCLIWLGVGHMGEVDGMLGRGREGFPEEAVFEISRH